MKFRLWFDSIATDGSGRHGDTRTVITARLISSGYALMSGELKLTVEGNHYALFANYADLQKGPSVEFDLPLPEPKPAQPKTDAERAAEALDRAALAICKGDKYGEALLAVNTARDILRAPKPVPPHTITVMLSCGCPSVPLIASQVDVGYSTWCGNCRKHSTIVRI